VVLSSTKVTTIESQAFVGLDGLEMLDLSHNQISDLPEDVFEPLHDIEEIKLQHNHLRNFSFDVFATNQNLQVVDLRFNNMTTLVPIQYKGEFSIEALIISFNDLTNISELCQLHKLEHMDLEGNQNLDFQTFKPKCWKNLRVLYLENTNLKSLNNDYRLFVGLNNLVILDLARNDLEILCVGNFPVLTALKQLNVEGNNLETVDPLELESKFKSLEEFVMERNPWDCNNFDNLTKAIEEMRISTHVQFPPLCYNSTTVKVSNSTTCDILNNLNSKQNSPISFTNYFLNFTLKLLSILVFFFLMILVTVHFFVIE
jgi:Leucine rich repeat